jgi:hypothetical protein
MRPKIPAAVARQLRQEAGFGRCCCGVPILQYHHIIPWAAEAHFRPEGHDGPLPHPPRRIRQRCAAPLFLAAELWKGGKLWKVTKNGIGASADGGDKPLGGVEDLALVGGALEVNSEGFTMESSDGSYIVSWPNRRERLWKAKNLWRQLQRNRREA